MFIKNLPEMLRRCCRRWGYLAVTLAGVFLPINRAGKHP
jgi:hypothetical protein